MTITTASREPRTRHQVTWRPFIRHYVEMVLAMAAGMFALHPLWTFGLRVGGAPQVLHHAELMALVMATDMSIGMGAWMAYRGHGWRDIAEMSAAMYLPFVIFFPATLAGAMSSGTMLAAGHVLMLFAMLAVMLWRREHYTCHRPARRPQEATARITDPVKNPAISPARQPSPKPEP